MWKESYRLGVDAIDRQHMALFDMTGHLLEAIKKPDTDELKKECESAILFMKNYVIEHFKDEEEYQKSIQYAGFTEHCLEHKDFTSNVLKYETIMAESNFDISYVKEFAGMVAAWLTYHVADSDQRIVRSESPKKIVSDSFLTAICSTLNTMAYLNRSDIKIKSGYDDFKGDTAIAVSMTGDASCKVEYVFTKEFAFRLIKSFLFMEVNALDRFTCSILSEITNIISKNAIRELAKAGMHCSLGTPSLQKPPFSSAEDAFFFDTRIGMLEFGIYL